MTETQLSKPWYKRWWAIILFIYFGLIIVGSFNDDNNPTDQKKAPVQQQETKKEININQKRSLTVPGIYAVDVYGSLKKSGFSCKGPESSTGDIVFWYCKKETTEYSYNVDIMGSSPSEILSISATALNYSNKTTASVTKDFLGYVASVPYDNSNQVAAKNWVIQNIEKNADTVINGVRFNLGGSQRSRILLIAHENSDLD